MRRWHAAHRRYDLHSIGGVLVRKLGVALLELRKAGRPRARDRQALPSRSQLFFTASREQRVCVRGARRRALVASFAYLLTPVYRAVRLQFVPSAELVFWDDNNRFKRRTTVTILVTRGAVLYGLISGGRAQLIRRARRGCRRVSRRGGP